MYKLISVLLLLSSTAYANCTVVKGEMLGDKTHTVGVINNVILNDMGDSFATSIEGTVYNSPHLINVSPDKSYVDIHPYRFIREKTRFGMAYHIENYQTNIVYTIGKCKNV